MRIVRLGSWKHSLPVFALGLILLMLGSGLPAAFGAMVPLLVTAQTTGSVAVAGVAITVTWNGTTWAQGQTGQDGSSIFYLNAINATYPMYNLTALPPTGFLPSSKQLLFKLNSTNNHLTLEFTPPPPQNALLVTRVLDQDSNPLSDVTLSFTRGALLMTQGTTNSTGYFQAILDTGPYNMTAKKDLYQTVVTPISLSKDGTLSNPTLGLVMSIVQQPAKGTYVVFTSQQLANVVVVGNQINGFRWVPIQTPAIIQVYYTTYNAPTDIIDYTTVFQGDTYADPSGNYFIRFTGSISVSGQAQFDVWSSKGVTQPVIVDAPGLSLPYVGTPGKTYQIPVSTKSGDTVDVKLNGIWFASFSWAPVTVNNQTLPQAVILDTNGNKEGYTYMTLFNQTLIEYGGNQGFGLELYKMIGTGTDSTAIWYIYSDLPITITPNIGFGTRPINLSTNPSIADSGQTVVVSFVIPAAVQFNSQTGVTLVPNDYDSSYGLQVQEIDATAGSWQASFKPTNDLWNTAKDYTISISATGNDGAKYFGKATLSVSPQWVRSVWFWVSFGFVVIVILSVAILLRRRRNEPSVEKTVME